MRSGACNANRSANRRVGATWSTGVVVAEPGDRDESGTKDPLTRVCLACQTGRYGGEHGHGYRSGQGD
jgi:hypothetical protein